MIDKNLISVALLAAFSCATCAKNESPTAVASSPANGSTSTPAPDTVSDPDCSFVRRGEAPELIQDLVSRTEAAHLGVGLSQPRLASSPVWVTLDQVKESWSVSAFQHDYAPSAKLEEHGENVCAGAMGDDGLFCPTAVVPGVQLSAEQVSRLLKLRSVEPSKTRLRCYEPHLSFVWFDESAVPRAELTVCLDCNYWSVNDGDLVPLSSETNEELESLCKEVGICNAYDLSTDDARLTEYRKWKTSGAPRPLWSRTSAKPDTPLAQLTLEEKRQLCAERAFDGSTRGVLEYESGDKVSFRSFDECVGTFPSCDVPLDALDYADFSTDSSSKSLFRVSPQCFPRWLKGPLGKCHWGVTLETTPTTE